MPREPQTTERPPPPAPEHRAQRIGDLLERRHMHMDMEEKEESYDDLFKILRYASTREDEYRMDMLQVFFLSYRWIGGPDPRYANITLKAEDMGYLKSHDMSMTFSDTDVSKIINQLKPSKTRTNNAADEERQCLMYLDAGYQMFRLLRALAVCGTRFARIWTLCDRPGGRTFAVETSRPLGNSDPMDAADFFSQVNLDLFPHNLIIPSPATNSFAVDYRKCELLERTFSRVCDSILSHTIESALQPRYEGAFDHGTEADPSAFTTEFLRDVEEFACQARPTLKKRRAGKEEVAQDRTFQRRDGSGGGSDQSRDSDNGEGPMSGGGKRVRRGGSGQNSQTKGQVQGRSGQ
ncbi:hypothetical protein J001_00107, partial [Cryptococcus neoformans]